jgi:hypothetical protein
MTAYALHRHAQRLVRQELRRRRAPLAGLPPDRREAVEELVALTVAAAAEGMLAHAREDPFVAAAFESIYGVRAAPTALSSVPARAD